MVSIAALEYCNHSPAESTAGAESTARLAALVQARLFPYIRKLTPDGHTAEDVLQETLLAMLERLPELRCPDCFWPWIRRIAHSKVQDHLRDRRRHRRMRETLAPDPAQALLPVTEPDTLDTILQEEALEQLAGALEQLSDRSRVVLHLRFHERMSYTEIAARMGATPGQIRTRLHRARKRLRNAFPATSSRTRAVGPCTDS